MELPESKCSLSGHVFGNATYSGRGTDDHLRTFVSITSMEESVPMNEDAAVTVKCVSTGWARNIADSQMRNAEGK